MGALLPDITSVLPNKRLQQRVIRALKRYAHTQQRRGQHVLHALSIDPGETHLGLSLVALDLRRTWRRVQSGRAQPLNSRNRMPVILDTDFDVRWSALWNLQAASADDDGPGATLARALRAIPQLAACTPVVRRLLGDARIHVFIEHQEGFDHDNVGLVQGLLRMNAIAGALFAFFSAHGHPVRLLGKRTKWGYKSFTATRDYAALSETAQRRRRKACITYYVSDLIRRQQERPRDGILSVPLQDDEPMLPRFFRRVVAHQMHYTHANLAFDDQAHSADSVVGAMFELRRIAQPNVVHDNSILPPDVWQPIARKAEERVPLSVTTARRVTAAGRSAGHGQRCGGNRGRGRKRNH